MNIVNIELFECFNVVSVKSNFNSVCKKVIFSNYVYINMVILELF